MLKNPPTRNQLSSCALAVALALAGGTGWLASATPAHAQAAPAVRGLPDFTELVEQVGPSVVNIRTTERVQRGQGMPGEEEMQEFLRRFFGGQMGRGQGRPGERSGAVGHP